MKKNKNIKNIMKFYFLNKKFSWMIIASVISLIVMILASANLVSILITVLFCGIMGYLFGYDLQNHTYNKSWYPTIGMLGTFIGIVVGLWNLDISNATKISESLSELLGGLKLAFLTSIAGLIFSMLRKLFDFIHWNEIKEKDQIAESLESIENNTKQFDTEDNVIDALNSLKQEFTKFAKKVSDSAAVQFADALSGIAHDLNNKLSEQFGANFKEFSKSVGQLIEWQEKNKQYLDNYMIQLENYTEEYTKQLKDYADIYNQKLDVLTNTSVSVEKIIEKTDNEILKLTKSLSSLDELGNEAKDCIPNIKKLISETNNEIHSIRTTAQTVILNVQEVSTKVEETIIDFTNELKGDIRQLFDNTQKELSQTSKSVVVNIGDTNKQLLSEIQQMNTKASNEIKETTSKLQGTVTKMNKSLGEASSYLAGGMIKMADTIYQDHEHYEECRARLESMTKMDLSENNKNNNKKRK